MMSIEELFQKKGSTIRLGLSHLESGLLSLGLGQHLSTRVLIGGTNGKGTVSTCLWLLLQGLYDEVGLYTSPHILDFAERIRVSHKPSLSTGDLTLAMNRFFSKELLESLSFFEITTLLAEKIFQEEQVKAQVMEVGLGGRLDATNAFNPDISCITSIGLDHQEYLGSTYGDIAKEKWAIRRPGKPMFWLQDHQTTLAQSRLETSGLEKLLISLKDPWVFCFGVHWFVDHDKGVFHLPGVPVLTWSLDAYAHEDHRFVQNLMGALAMFWWIAYHDQKILKPEEALKKGWSILKNRLKTALPGRSQRISLGGHAFYLDVAHNPDAMAHLLVKLETHKIRPKAVIFAALKDKDVSAMISLLKTLGVPIFGFELSSSRGMSVSDAMVFYEKHAYFGSFSKLLAHIGPSFPTSAEEPFLVCGSFLTVSSVLSHMGWQVA